ncbi:hypothetical protein NC653_002833 [Populus alba x Populus x berolinensis]|uniref:Uncharacterized protein n=1 Tax=Populus alba x Populus x berolinensis TaxID=444605 RepID=A0AAD6WIC7_9ROSI|nr:hypothetical protein NC653_002833 [Populus alba x Populus x berolinensis]
MLLLTGRWVLGGWVLWRFHYPSVFLPRKLLQTLGVEIDFFGFNIQLVLLSSHHSHSVWVLLVLNLKVTESVQGQLNWWIVPKTS